MNFYDGYNHWSSRFSSSRLWEKSEEARKGKVDSCWLSIIQSLEVNDWLSIIQSLEVTIGSTKTFSVNNDLDFFLSTPEEDLETVPVFGSYVSFHQVISRAQSLWVRTSVSAIKHMHSNPRTTVCDLVSIFNDSSSYLLGELWGTPGKISAYFPVPRNCCKIFSLHQFCSYYNVSGLFQKLKFNIFRGIIS